MVDDSAGARLRREGQARAAAQPLAEQLAPCGPVIDAAAVERAREAIGASSVVERAWPALAPVFGSSPYLARLAARRPEALTRRLASDPEESLQEIVAGARAAGALATHVGAARLRRLKAELHLLTALCDLGGVWRLDQVTAALTRFADAALKSAFELVARSFADRLAPFDAEHAGPLPGLFVIALGKQGAFELNYSSDIDVCLFYEPAALPLPAGADADAFATRFTRAVAELLQDRTGDGYVFRVDLRLRPDPASTGPAVPIDQALTYYESVGQNWERAALIKARVAAGDIPRGEAFLAELQPFIWRRNLDFAAIADIHSIKRQIADLRPDSRLAAPGADLKLGPGGIREIEFFVQTQQLILGGRHLALRSPRTLDALTALGSAGHVSSEAAEELALSYETLRSLEHRIQMVGDEQTHTLPRLERERRRVAALAGAADLRRFDASVARTLKVVARRYGELFAGEEALSSRFGSLVFTGVEDDPETLRTLRKMGFADPRTAAATVRAWHHGRIAATRSERGRELFTRLAPRLLDAAAATGAPDAAFARFGDFFGGLSVGAQVQALFLAQPKLLELIVQVMAIAPAFARALARGPAALDALMDASFFAPLEPLEAVPAALSGADGFEAAMDAARRAHRERTFQIGLQVLAGTASAAAAGEAFAELAEACIAGLAVASLAEVERQGGRFPGEVAVVALGKCGSREMTTGSDLDLMTFYAPIAPDAVSAERGWAAETFYGRFTGRLITALSAPTSEGGLYEVDMQLRPSGTKGPVAVSLAAFDAYYAGAADTWEYLALTRARVVWATSAAFAQRAAAAIEEKLRAPRDATRTAADVLDMRHLIARERPAAGFWDLKLHDGGLVDIEFAAQLIQLVHASAGGPLRQSTLAALSAAAEAGLASAELIADLTAAWRLEQDLSQLLKIALPDGGEPEREPKALGALLARAAGVRDLRGVRAALTQRRPAAHRAFRAIVARP
jgi:glutamate-ammonia-ligase adenylyltransferase